MKHAEELTVRRWQGRPDLSELQRTVACAAPDPQRFRADSRTCRGAGALLLDWQSTELSGTSAAEPRSADLQLVIVTSGRMVLDCAGTRWSGTPGGLHLLRADEPVQWSLAHGTRVVQLRIAGAGLPAHLQDRALLRPGALAETPLTLALGGALGSAAVAIADAPSAAGHVCRGVHGLALAVLEQLAPEAEHAEQDLRQRIVAHIERNLGEQDLNPRTIADAFDVSLRWVHSAFNTPDESLARYIRRRRVDAVASTLQVERQVPRLSGLAARYGFSGREQLARCFRARYGVTVGDYYGLVLDDLPLPQPAADDRRKAVAA